MTLKTNLAVILTLASASTFAAEIERGPASPTQNPAVAAPVAPISQSLSDQIDAALNPRASIEASGEAMANATTVLQGGAAQTAAAAPQAVDATGADATAAPPLAPTQARAAAKAAEPRAPKAGEKRDTSRRALHATAIVFIIATILAYAALIYGFTNYVNDVDRQLQQQMQEADDWGR